MTDHLQDVRPWTIVPFEGANGDWYWRIKAGNGDKVADGSEGYSTESNCKRAIETFLLRMCHFFGTEPNLGLATNAQLLDELQAREQDGRIVYPTARVEGEGVILADTLDKTDQTPGHG